MTHFLLSSVISCLFFSCNEIADNKSSSESITHSTHVNEINSDTTNNKRRKNTVINISAVGDIMLGTNFPNNATLPPDANSLLMPADSLLRNASITFGNAEGVFLNEGGESKGSGANVYNFRQPESYAGILKNYGFDFLSIANNHAYDFGQIGLENTSKVFEKNGLKFAGNKTNPYVIIERDGIKIGMVAFAPHNGCLNLNDRPAVIALVKEVKTKCDILMVSFHAGAEGSKATRVPRRHEIFYDQDRGDVYETAHAVIDAGADIVIGHGPHVPRGIELYKSHLIAYSLGNFCTYAKFNLKGISGYAPLLNFNVDGNGSFIKGKIYSFLQLGEGGPVKDESDAAAKLIKQLSAEDFPESPLLIDQQGNISINKSFEK
jgi:poly-gamma-glutamate capsule biosynthesis protein CapA/YwtB (metallophosphatase superfamily)